MPGRVLIIDELATNRIILKVKLSAAYYDVVQAASVEAACDQMDDLRPDLILLGQRSDEAIPLSKTLARLQARADSASNLPIVLLLDSDMPGARIDALLAGATEVMSRPLDEQLLLARLRSLMRKRLSDLDMHHHALAAHNIGFAEQAQDFHTPGQVGLIAQDRQAARKLQSRLAAHVDDSLRLMGAAEMMGTPATAVRTPQLPSDVPDMFLLQLETSQQQDGFRLLSELRADPDTRNCPVIVLLPRDNTALAAQLYDLGAGDVVFHGTDPREMALRIQQQMTEKRRQNRLHDQVQDGLRAAVMDQLTGLHNRRYALSYLKCLTNTPDPSHETFAVMVADLDYFKQVNDTYGHAAGDAVLVHVAQTLKSYLRKDDLVARIGGEEFLIIIPGTTQQEARKIATGLCARIRSTAIPLPGQATPAKVTISIGLTLGNAQSSSAEDLINQADRALYSSKAAGRNTVRFAARSAA